MKHTARNAMLLAAILVLAFLGGRFVIQHLSGLKPVIQGPPVDIGTVIDDNNPLILPERFNIEVFAKDLPGARVAAFDQFGNLWVSQTRTGTVSKIPRNIGESRTMLSDLKNPHGLAFDPENPNILYIAEEDKLSRVDTTCLGVEPFECVSDFPHKIIDLPAGGRHTTRTIGFGPDGRLYVSIGSSCDVCHEDDPRRGTIQTVDIETGTLQEFAKGLRNAVFFTWRSDQMWTTEMGRDMLGDNLPPDEINLVSEEQNYGWPICYGKNIHDTEFDKNTYIRNPCQEPFEKESFIDIPAHSAPLGLVFVPEGSNWPEEYIGNLLIAYHGSWNRSTPTGYKIVLIDPKTRTITDFITGWLTPDNEALGRPVDLKFGPDNNLYISDDKAGVIYRVTYVGNEN